VDLVSDRGDLAQLELRKAQATPALGGSNERAGGWSIPSRLISAID
jgi:hypothetical protein